MAGVEERDADKELHMRKEVCKMLLCCRALVACECGYLGLGVEAVERRALHHLQMREDLAGCGVYGGGRRRSDGARISIAHHRSKRLDIPLVGPCRCCGC